MALHHAPFALCVAEANPSQSPNVTCNLPLPLVMKDDMHGHHHHHHLHDYERMSKIPTNGKSAWTDTATECLIDVFEEKWNSLRRGNLKAKNWDEVGIELGHRCGVPKTGDQCRHKIEKLRGRFRQEKVVSNFGQSKWPWYDRLNQVFGDKVRLLRDAAEYDSGEKASAEIRSQEAFQQENVIDEGPALGATNQHELIDIRAHADTAEDKNDKGDASFTSNSHKAANSTDKDDAGTPKSKSGGRSKKRQRDCLDFGAAMKSLGESLFRIEECKLELQRDNERLRVEMESKRAQMQEVELKRTEMLIQMELKRTEMLCDLELRRTRMQMDLFERLANNRANPKPKRST